MGTSWGPVIDYLVTALTDGVTTPPNVVAVYPNGVTLPPLSSIDPTVQVVDNMPAETTETMVVIGRRSPESGQSGDVSNTYVELGANRVEEQYTLPGYVCVWRPGPAQKPSRDAAVALFNAIVALLHADPTLGGLLSRGRIGMLSRFSPHQTQDDQDTAGGGYLYTGIDFELEIHNTYTI